MGKVIAYKKKNLIPALLLGFTLAFGVKGVSAAPGDQIFVNGSSGNDANDGYSWATAKQSIKNAIETVNENGVVKIADGQYTGENNRNIDINKNMKIQGQSTIGTIINGTSADRIFTIQSGKNVSIQNLTITNGHVTNDNGSAILNNGILTVNRCNFTNNTAEANPGDLGSGGAIYNSGNLTVSNSIFTGNTANAGGGIFNDNGTLTVTGSKFIENTASWYGAGIATIGVDGIVTVTGCKFLENSGRGIAIDSSMVIVTNCTFTRNNNSGIDNQGILAVIDSVFAENKGNDGGAISALGPITAIGCTFINNTATQNGGAIISMHHLTVTDCTFKENSANDGGAILSNGELTVNSSVFKSNTANNNGGAIYNLYGVLTVNDSTFKINKAKSGGGIFNDHGTLTSASCTFTRNTGGTIVNIP